MYVDYLNCKRCGNEFMDDPFKTNGICGKCEKEDHQKIEEKEAFDLENRLIAKSLRKHEYRLRKIEEDLLNIFNKIEEQDNNSSTHDIFG